MSNERFIFWLWESLTTGCHACKVKKHFICLMICIYFLPYLFNDFQTIRSTMNFSKPLANLHIYITKMYPLSTARFCI